MWWDMADLDGLEMLSIRVGMIGCRPEKEIGGGCEHVGRGRKTCGGCVKDDMKLHGLQPE